MINLSHLLQQHEAPAARHFPIWRRAQGSILVTGLGLGCVVRALLREPGVEHVTVIEKCPHIAAAIWPEFRDDGRSALLHGDARDCALPARRFDWAWHDLWSDESAGEPPLAQVHLAVIRRFAAVVDRQGAWALPRPVKRMIGGEFFTKPERASVRA